MHGKPSKKKSKRTKLSMKYKIQKKVREHHRKLKKEMKKNPHKFRKRKCDPGIPNSVPFKAEVIQEAEEAKMKEEERRQKIRMELKLKKKNERSDLFNSNRNISDYVENSFKKNEEFESKQNFEKDNALFSDKSAKAYFKELKKVIEAADVILEVLDARDPLGSRCIPLEDLILKNPSKRLVLVLNKSDLIPRESLDAWLKYLRARLPTLPFKASTQKQNENISQVRFKTSKFKSLQTSKCVGADVLMQLLKNYSRNAGIKTTISVGVVGLPNVGKSSLINSLKRNKACNIGATPGITKTVQEVSLDKKVRILDCPGLILPGENSSDIFSSLRNAHKLEKLRDPVTPVQAILEKVGKEQIMIFYKLSSFDDTQEFLALLSKRLGKLKKGGTPDVHKAAITVLRDWNIGKIKYYTYPPTEIATNDETKSALVETMSKEFTLEEIHEASERAIDTLPKVLPTNAVRVSAAGPLQTMEGFCDEEEMEVSETPEVQHSNILPENLKIVTIREEPSPVETEMEEKPRNEGETELKVLDLSAVSLKKFQKVQSKKQRKEERRTERKTQELIQAFESFEGITDENGSYDFTEYFSKK